MILLACAITQCFSNTTNNRLRTSSNTKNQTIVQADIVQIQSRNSGNDGRNTRRSYVLEEVIEGTNVQNDVANIQRTLRTTTSGTVANMLLAKQDETRVILTDEHNDFLSADASRMEEIEELRPSYDSAFLSKVQTPSTNYVNPLFAKDKQEQKYLKQPKIISNTIGDDQIDSNIIFDEPNEDVNSGSVEYDNNVQESYELEKLARNAFKEAEKQQMIAKRSKKQQRDKLELSVVELKRQTVKLQKTQSILKHKMSENEDKYHDTILDLEARAKKNADVVFVDKNNA
ncbi:hypothetical protein Tco_0523596 [Tanacetum coccineum]